MWWTGLAGFLSGGVLGYYKGLQPAQDTIAMYKGVMPPEMVCRYYL